METTAISIELTPLILDPDQCQQQLQEIPELLYKNFQKLGITEVWFWTPGVTGLTRVGRPLPDQEPRHEPIFDLVNDTFDKRQHYRHVLRNHASASLMTAERRASRGIAVLGDRSPSIEITAKNVLYVVEVHMRTGWQNGGENAAAKFITNLAEIKKYQCQSKIGIMAPTRRTMLVAGKDSSKAVWG